MKNEALRKVLQILMLISVIILTVLFAYSSRICIRIASIGNIFFLLWIIFGDPLKSKIAFKLSNRIFIEFLVCAIVVWIFSYMLNSYGLCEKLADMFNVFGKYFG